MSGISARSSARRALFGPDRPEWATASARREPVPHGRRAAVACAGRGNGGALGIVYLIVNRPTGTRSSTRVGDLRRTPRRAGRAAGRDSVFPSAAWAGHRRAGSDGRGSWSSAPPCSNRSPTRTAAPRATSRTIRSSSARRGESRRRHRHAQRCELRRGGRGGDPQRPVVLLSSLHNDSSRSRLRRMPSPAASRRHSRSVRLRALNASPVASAASRRLPSGRGGPSTRRWSIPPPTGGQLARAFERIRLRLATLDRARAEFIANASHELRTRCSR